MSSAYLGRFAKAVRCPHGLIGWIDDEGNLIIQHGSNAEARLVFMEYRTENTSDLTRDLQQALRRTLEWARRACEYEGVRSEALTLEEEREAYYALVMDRLTPQHVMPAMSPSVSISSLAGKTAILSPLTDPDRRCGA